MLVLDVAFTNDVFAVFDTFGHSAMAAAVPPNKTHTQNICLGT